MNRIRTIYGLLSLVSLIFGVVIYFLFRDLNNLMLFSWIPKFKIFESTLVLLKPSIFTNVIKYNLSDMLWFISVILFIRYFWFYNIKNLTIYIICLYIIGFAFEIIQMLGNVPGTFDWLDLLFMGIGAFVEGLLYKKIILRRCL